MLKLEDFKGLTIEDKSDYLYRILHSRVKNDKKRERNFLVFIYNAEDGDLVEFYDAILHPEKRHQYMDNQNKKISQWNEELKKINKDFTSARIEMYESLDKNEADNILNDIE